MDYDNVNDYNKAVPKSEKLTEAEFLQVKKQWRMEHFNRVKDSYLRKIADDVKSEIKKTFLWDQFKHTDPKFTKPFPKFGKTLTTIDPMYQVMTMTRVFGPVGKGWSYDAKYHYTDANVFAEVKIVYCIEDIWYRYGPVSSVCALYKKAGTLDDEAPKKALTDAMTKAFSHLGVSADVFLGLFDNNKYVATMKEKFNGKATKDEGIKAKVVQINKNNKEKNNDK